MAGAKELPRKKLFSRFKNISEDGKHRKAYYIMRIETIAAAIAKLRESKEHELFNNPPQTMEDFKERKGIWMGLGEALRLIEDAKRKEGEDD